MVESVVVKLPPPGWVPGPPPHATPTAVVPDLKLHVVRDNEALHPETRAQGERVRRLATYQDHQGRPVVLNPPALERLDSTALHDYVAVASRDHAYWFCVYQEPKSMAQLALARQDPNPNTRAIAESELSKETLLELLDARKFHGLEIIKHHAPGRTIGVVIDARYHRPSQQVQVLIRPFSTEGGRMFVNLVEFGIMRGCSLSHCEAYDVVKLYEISLCFRGARPGTNLLRMVKLKSDERYRRYHSRMFSPPEYHAQEGLQVTVQQAKEVPSHRCRSLANQPLVWSSTQVSLEMAAKVVYHERQRKRARTRTHASLVDSYNR